MMKHGWFKTFLWGISVALSWMWGLGLFFSVQFTYQFGITGLLTFAIPNALGLILFGIATHWIAKREGRGSESLANFFSNWSRPFRLVFYLYQLLAVTLTMFAIIRYLWMPLNLHPDALYLPLTILIVMSAAFLFGEEFNIKRIKYSHGILFAILLSSIGVILLGLLGDFNLLANISLPHPSDVRDTVQAMAHDLKFWSYVIPICIGFLVGPWLDLQQWQRAIQMRRENISVSGGYIIGGLIFFSLLFFHGSLASWAMSEGAGLLAVQNTFDGLTYAQSMLTSFFFQMSKTAPWFFIAYAVFISVCILTTLDSGYIALKWFLSQSLKGHRSALLALIPERILTSPIPSFIFAGMFTLFAVVAKLELEYFMVFYATFFVAYAGLGISRCFIQRQGNSLPQIKLSCLGSVAVVVFAYGYFLRLPVFLILGSVLPLGYLIWMLFKPYHAPEFVTGSEELEEPAPMSTAASSITPADSTPTSSEARGVSPGGYFEGKWFVHSFIATYADTNSVGNVYFGMYAMWVGKTRELFFNQCLPKFNLKTSPFYILTRSFEHKFLRETREFEEVKVKIRIGKYNRKFVTLEHEVYDSANQLLGKGEQTLMFVSSSSYALIDLPPEVYSAFIAYA